MGRHYSRARHYHSYSQNHSYTHSAASHQTDNLLYYVMWIALAVLALPVFGLVKLFSTDPDERATGLVMLIASVIIIAIICIAGGR